MTTKEKLDLLWKYLLLVVLVYGFFQIGRLDRPPAFAARHLTHHPGAVWFDKDWDADEWKAWKDMDFDVDMDVEAMLEELDSTISITINGEVLSLDEIKGFKHDGHQIIIKTDDDGEKGKKKKIIRMRKKDLDE